MQPTRAVVFESDNRLRAQLVLQSQAPELSLRHSDILVDVPGTDRRQCATNGCWRRRRTCRAVKHTAVAHLQRLAKYVDGGVVGNVLDDVERDVAEVPLV